LKSALYVLSDRSVIFLIACIFQSQLTFVLHILSFLCL